jgi:hypothetical protein
MASRWRLTQGEIQGDGQEDGGGTAAHHRDRIP